MLRGISIIAGRCPKTGWCSKAVLNSCTLRDVNGANGRYKVRWFSSDDHDDHDHDHHSHDEERAKLADVHVKFQKKDGSLFTCVGKEGDILLRLAQRNGIELEGNVT
jgi:hypothetical protein